MVTKGPHKGYTGYVYGANYIRKNFLVDLISVGKRNIDEANLVYL
jgi:hypothetical protein